MLKVKNLSFSYTDKTVLKNISFSLGAGNHLAIIGESGSGKSTLLNLIYGKHDLIDGKISWKDTQILGPAYNLVIGYDFIKYVSQEFDLMPFITVEENIGKFLSNFYPEKKKKRSQELIEIVELEAFSKIKVKNLSGGQKQRVAIARALAKEPEILLLDEPFSNIDNFKKQTLRRKLFGYLKKNNISCITATHDKDDVLGFADDLLVLNKGDIIAKGSPQQLYKNPEDKLIAAFFGAYNELEISSLDALNNANSQLIYAHQLVVVTKSDFKVVVEHSYFNGMNYLISSNYNGKEILFFHEKSIKKGQQVYLEIKEK